MKNNIIKVIIIISLIVTFVNCYNIYSQINLLKSKKHVAMEFNSVQENESVKIKKYKNTILKTTKEENLVNNAINSSYALVDENDNLYIFNLGIDDSYGGLYLGDLKSHTLKKLGINNGRCITYLKDSLFFIGSDEQKIIKYDINKKEVTDVTSESVDNLLVYKGSIYYILTNRSDRCPIVKLDIDNRENKKVYNVNCGEFGSFCIADDWIYFTNADDNLYIYKMKISGTDLKQLSYYPSECINIEGNWIYYTANIHRDRMGGYYHSLYKIKTDGSENTLLVSDGINEENANNALTSVRYINVYNDWVYFVDAKKNGSVFRVNINNQQIQRLNDFADCYGLTIVNDRIIFRSYIDPQTSYTYSMNLDGTDKKTFKIQNN